MVEKKKFKIIESEMFKEQKKKLPKRVQVALKKALKEVIKDPFNAKNTMSVGGDFSARELKNWADDVSPIDIDMILEYLQTKGCLNEMGEQLAKEFYNEYLRDKGEHKIKW